MRKNAPEAMLLLLSQGPVRGELKPGVSLRRAAGNAMNQLSMLVGFGLPHHVHVGMRQHPGVFVFRGQVQVIVISRMGVRIGQSHSAKAPNTE